MFCCPHYLNGRWCRIHFYCSRPLKPLESRILKPPVGFDLAFFSVKWVFNHQNLAVDCLVGLPEENNMNGYTGYELVTACLKTIVNITNDGGFHQFFSVVLLIFVTVPVRLLNHQVPCRQLARFTWVSWVWHPSRSAGVPRVLSMHHDAPKFQKSGLPMKLFAISIHLNNPRANFHYKDARLEACTKCCGSLILYSTDTSKPKLL